MPSSHLTFTADVADFKRGVLCRLFDEADPINTQNANRQFVLLMLTLH